MFYYNENFNVVCSKDIVCFFYSFLSNEETWVNGVILRGHGTTHRHRKLKNSFSEYLRIQKKTQYLQKFLVYSFFSNFANTEILRVNNYKKISFQHFVEIVENSDINESTKFHTLCILSDKER